MSGDFDAGRLPEVGDVSGEPGIPHGDEFDTRSLRESQDTFWRPVWVAVECIDDGFPGVNIHNIAQHFRSIDLDNEAIEETGVDSISCINEGGELLTNIFFVKEFSVGYDINVGIFLEDFE